MMDTASHTEIDQKLFHIKSVHLKFLSPDDQLHKEDGLELFHLQIQSWQLEIDWDMVPNLIEKWWVNPLYHYYLRSFNGETVRFSW
jgi:hypothetical protein